MAEVFLRHGGRLSAAQAAFPRAPQPWLDLSTGINPQPWRGARAPRAALARLPDPAEIGELEAVAAEAFGAEPANVAALPGAEAAIRAMPALTGARSVDIVSPTYGGHAEAWRLAGVPPRAISRGQASAAEALVIVNPNNPDGAISEVEERSGWTIVDESFVETAAERSVAARAGGRLIVLRSFGKFYGLPGVRLGFVIAEPALAEALRVRFGDWRINAEAVAMGAGAYADSAWRTAAGERLVRDAARLDRLLAAAGFEPVGGTSLFRLVHAPDAAARFHRLAEAGVLVRPFPDKPTWLRFGLPPRWGWSRLKSALEAP